jgi:hypothetical protein
VWLIGWLMAFRWMKLRLVLQLHHLKKETSEAKELVLELQKAQENWLQQESRRAQEYSLLLLHQREQGK